MLARLSAALLLIHAAAAQQLVVEKVDGQEIFALKSEAVAGLSGLVWTRGDAFFAVSDHRNTLVPLTLNIDPATGRIASGALGTPIPVPADARDFEGVAYVSATRAFYIAAETGHAVLRFVPGQPRAVRQPVPAVFAQARKNLSLESLTWNDTAQQFWIANEETLAPDGPLADPAAGSLVRLQRFDARFRPTAQFAWRTEPAAFRFHGAGSGVADLCLLPDGRLLVLERGFGPGGLHLRLYLAGWQNATDTARLPALAGADIIPATKILLYEQPTGFINFEGLALGPPLADGSRSLLVIADSNGGPTHALLPLRLRVARERGPGVPPGEEPTDGRDAHATPRPVGGTLAAPKAPPPHGTPAWNQLVERRLQITDSAGHGPDLGSAEWMGAVGKKCGLSNSPKPGTDAWFRAVDAKVFGQR